MLVKKQHLEPYMEQLTGSKLGNEYDMAVYCPPCLFNFYAEYIVWNARIWEDSKLQVEVANGSILNYILHKWINYLP